MNLQETIRRILREEDFIPLESLYLDIKDYDGGFDVFIMNGDKKIGEISFVKESLPNQYTIVDATIDDEYKGNRIYPKTAINLFKERPNIIINSLFRSPEANKAWIYLLSNLPPNIGKSVKYYKEEDTTLFQLKLRNLQETIRRILRENDYSPAGKEVIPNKIVVHKSNPMFRDKILQDGLKVKAGKEAYGVKAYGTPISGVGGEWEVLLPRGTTFVIRSIQERAPDASYGKPIWDIEVDLVDQTPAKVQ